MNLPLVKKRKGFTLVELLVVISIISLLTSISLAFINGTRAKARDAQAIANLRQIQRALEFFYDTYGFYPIPVGGGYDIGNNCCWDVISNGNGFMRFLEGTVVNGGVTVNPQNIRFMVPPTAPPGYIFYYYAWPNTYGGCSKSYMLLVVGLQSGRGPSGDTCVDTAWNDPTSSSEYLITGGAQGDAALQ